MAITPLEDQLVKETIEASAKVAKEVVQPVRISPDRMNALQNAARLRFTINIEGTAVHYVEDPQAPESLLDALNEAKAPPTPPPLAQGARCTECGGQTVLLENGDVMCVRCRCVQVEEPKSKIILASERAALRKHPSKRH
jgi:hypothetical protein